MMRTTHGQFLSTMTAERSWIQNTESGGAVNDSDWNYHIWCERCGNKCAAGKVPVIGGACHFCWTAEEHGKFWSQWFRKQFFDSVNGRMTIDRTAWIVIKALRENPVISPERIKTGIDEAYIQGELSSKHSEWSTSLLTLIEMRMHVR